MWRLPDTVQLGPLPLPVSALTVVLGVAAWYVLARRVAPGWRLDPDLAEDFVFKVLLGGFVGAKLLDILRSPELVLANPIALVTLPRGSGALWGALLGAGVWTLPLVLRRRHEVPALLDAMAVPLGVGLAISGLGLTDGRTLPLTAGFAGATLFLAVLRRQSRFPGHLALALVVLGAVVVSVADFFRFTPTMAGGLSQLQLGAAGAAAAAYTGALWLEQRQTRPDKE